MGVVKFREEGRGVPGDSLTNERGRMIWVDELLEVVYDCLPASRKKRQTSHQQERADTYILGEIGRAHV